MSVHVLLSEVMSHGGMQRYNQVLIRAVLSFARAHGVRAKIWSLNDSAQTPGISGCARSRKRFLLSAFVSALREQPKIVIIGHVHFASLAAVYRVISPRSRLYALAHGKEVETPLSVHLRAGLRLCAGVLVVSESTKALVVRQQGVSVDRVHVLYYGFEPEADSRGSGPVDDDGLSLLSVTRLATADRYKGIHTTLEAVSSLISEFPDLRYTVVGDGNDRAWLEQHARDLGILDRVRFAGHVSDVELNELYDACDVFVLPSTHEGLGIVYLEAMARGKPVIGVRAGGVADVVVHEANGLLIVRANVENLRSSIQRLADDASLRARLGAWGRQHTVPAFSFARMVAELTKILGPHVAETATKRADA